MNTSSEPLNVFVTGSQGYIGSQLVRYLKDCGHHVTGLDAGYYVDGLLYSVPGSTDMDHIQKDVRSITEEDLAGADAVVHLAELSNDPLGMHNEENTYAINHQGSVRLAELCKNAGVSRFVYTSSCSVYGVQNGDEIKTEASTPIPQTAYAKCKVLVERDVAALADETFVPTFLRNATAYGPSPRMRFDIVLNNLAGMAWTTNNIRVLSDGSPWRPLVHVKDICQAIACSLAAPPEVVQNEVFNVGDTAENYQIRDLGKIIAEAFPDAALSIGTSEDEDNRSYRVSFDKIQENLPGFVCKHTVRDGANELRDTFEEVGLSQEMFSFRSFTRLKQLKYLLETEQLDKSFRWMNKKPSTPSAAGTS